MSSAPIALPRRILHWTNLIAIVVLAITGWYIHKPSASVAMGVVRNVHFVFAFIFSLNLLVRIYYAFTAEGDWKRYLKPQITNEKIRLTLRHYFLFEHLPEGEEYRILQNAAYLVLVLLFGVQIFTGILMYNPEGPNVAGTINQLGGLSQIRQIHLFFQWIFISFTLIHLYMVCSEELWEIKNMFFGIAGKKEATINER